MANYYRLEYENVLGHGQRVDLIRSGTRSRIDNYILLQGTYNLEYEEADDPFQILTPSTATINIEFDLENPYYEDLYSEVEREWQVRIYREGSSGLEFLVWEGYLLPDQIYEDYVNSRWVVSLRAECGLAGLSNKAYLDANGNFYTGRASLRQIIKNCLDKTENISNISYQQRSASTTDFPVQVVSGVSPQDYFDQQVEQRAFISDDGKSAKSCEDVLKEILGPVNGAIYLYGPDWLIDWNPQAANPFYTQQRYQRYADGDPLATPTNVINSVVKTIGPERASYDIHWVNANQRIERRASIGKARALYEYGSLGALNSNPALDNDGVTISGWTVNDGVNVTLRDYGGVEITSGGTFNAKFTSDVSSVNVDEGNIIVIELVFAYYGTEPRIIPRYQLSLQDGGTTYYLRRGDFGQSGDLQWVTNSQTGGFDTYSSFSVNGAPGSFTVTIECPPAPATGPIQMKLYPGGSFVGTTGTHIIWDYVGIGSKDDELPLGEEHHAQRITAPSSYVQDEEAYTLGDYRGSVFLGTLYKEDGTSLTDEGYSNPIRGVGRSLYATTVMDKLFVVHRPARIFEGDVFISNNVSGWLEPNALVEVAGFDDVRWKIIGWSFDSRRATITLKLWEMHWQEDTDILVNPVYDDIEYEKILNFGNVSSPTIK